MLVGNWYGTCSYTNKPAAAMAQSGRAFASYPEVIESQSQQTYVVKTCTVCLITKRSATGVSVKGPQKWQL